MSQCIVHPVCERPAANGTSGHSTTTCVMPQIPGNTAWNSRGLNSEVIDFTLFHALSH
jgi:hypothetical protein